MMTSQFINQFFECQIIRINFSYIDSRDYIFSDEGNELLLIGNINMIALNYHWFYFKHISLHVKDSVIQCLSSTVCLEQI